MINKILSQLYSKTFNSRFILMQEISVEKEKALSLDGALAHIAYCCFTKKNNKGYSEHHKNLTVINF